MERCFIPGNSVTAAGSYWLAAVQSIMAFEQSRPGICHRVRYEDLVTAPLPLPCR